MKFAGRLVSQLNLLPPPGVSLRGSTLPPPRSLLGTSGGPFVFLHTEPEAGGLQSCASTRLFTLKKEEEEKKKERAF